MVLVLFLLGIVLLVSLFIFLILLSTLRIDIQKINIIADINRKDKVEKNLLIYLGIYLMGKWKLLRIKINDEKIEKMNVKEKIQKIDIEKLKQNKLINMDTFNRNVLFKIRFRDDRFYPNNDYKFYDRFHHINDITKNHQKI